MTAALRELHEETGITSARIVASVRAAAGAGRAGTAWHTCAGMFPGGGDASPSFFTHRSTPGCTMISQQRSVCCP